MERRLAAILAADVVGYSRLMGEDEAGTLATLSRLRKETIEPLITAHRGRVVKLMGDGILAEFASVVDAVNCAVAWQNSIADATLKFRIGVNLGDIIIEDGDIYGDGVNVAARLETISDPVGICISSIVHESLGNRVEVEFVDAGEHLVKNIAKPIRVYRWPAEARDHPSVENDKTVAGVSPTPPQHKPVISVTPFESLSNDSEAGFLCEGLAEDIITAIGNVSQLTVVAHKTAESSGGEAAGQRTVRYVLEGSVRKAGNRIRVSAHLLDKFSGVQCWAQRYDRDASDMFDVQDDLARNIVIAVHTELGAGSYTNRWQHGTNDFEAWQLTAKSFNEFQKHSPESMAKCAAMWDEAAALDPDYFSPRIASAYCYAHMALWKDPETASEYLAKAESAFEAAVAADPRDSRPYSAKRGIEIARGNHEAAIAAAKKGFELDPTERRTLAHAYMCAGMPEEALTQINKSIQDIPNYPGWFAMIKIQAHYMLDQLTEAVLEAENIVERAPDFYYGPVLLAALYVETDRLDDARDLGQKILQMYPESSTEMLVKSQGLKNAEHRERLSSALTRAGLPE